MQRDKRDTAFWHNSASKSNLGPGFYEFDDKAPSSKVPFWSRKERFNIRERLFPTPGPGHYSVKHKPESHLSNNVKWSVSKVEVSDTQDQRFNSEKGQAFKTAPLNSELENTALANWEDDMPPKKPRPVIRNDKSFKDSKSSQILRQILHGTTPSIPYSKFNSTENTLPPDDKLGPGFYKPKFNLVEKKVSVTKLRKEKKTQNPRKNMEQFINNVILDDVYSQRFSKAVKAIASTSKDSKPVTFRKMSEPEETTLKNGIFQTQLSRQSFIFKSKTKKSQPANLTPVPGPGEYMLNTKHEIFKKLPQNFGSSEKREPVWMRANGSRAPYIKASILDTPGVGHYHLQKTRVASLGKSERLIGYQRRSTATQKLESAVRTAIISGGIQKAANVVTEGKLKQQASKERFPSPTTETPGPGSYYIPSQTDINLVEFKYNPKYRDAPFGNRTPRFKGKREKEVADEPVEADRMSKAAHSTDTNEPLRLNRVPSSLSRQESYIFKSNVDRFAGGAFDTGPRSQSTVPPERPDLSDDFKTEKERPRIKLRKQHEQVNVPFGASTPRKFDYMKINENPHLGPGVYSDLDTNVSSKPVLKGEVTFKKEKRWKEEREEDLGPGLYYTPSTLLKRTYNTSLPPPKQYILKQNIQL